MANLSSSQLESWNMSVIKNLNTLVTSIEKINKSIEPIPKMTKSANSDLSRMYTDLGTLTETAAKKLKSLTNSLNKSIQTYTSTIKKSEASVLAERKRVKALDQFAEKATEIEKL